MKRIFVVSFLFAAILLSPVFAVKSLVRLENLSTQDHKTLSKLNLDVAKAGKTFIEVVLDENQIKTIVKGKYKFSVIVPDLDRYVTKIIHSQTKEAKYFTYQTMTDALKTYASKFPKICRLESIGKSCEKRDIWALKISDNPEKNEKEPAACVMGAHHSREWISVEVPMGTIKSLIDGYGKDPEVTRLVNEREIWVIPMVNPDGVTYSQTKEKYWRRPPLSSLSQAASSKLPVATPKRTSARLASRARTSSTPGMSRKALALRISSRKCS